jgi:hypothetical protein
LRQNDIASINRFNDATGDGGPGGNRQKHQIARHCG